MFFFSISDRHYIYFRVSFHLRSTSILPFQVSFHFKSTPFLFQGFHPFEVDIISISGLLLISVIFFLFRFLSISSIFFYFRSVSILFLESISFQTDIISYISGFIFISDRNQLFHFRVSFNFRDSFNFRNSFHFRSTSLLF